MLVEAWKPAWKPSEPVTAEPKQLLLTVYLQPVAPEADFVSVVALYVSEPPV